MKVTRALAILGLLVSLVSCDLLGLFDPIVGTYSLTSETIYGTVVPAGSYGVSGSFSAKSDGTFSLSLASSSGSSTISGTWTKTSSGYTLTEQTTSETLTATLTGKNLTIVADPNFSFLFAKN